MDSLSEQILQEYPGLIRWGTPLFQQDASDFIHDAVVELLSHQYGTVTDAELIGLWKILTNKACTKERTCQHGRVPLTDVYSDAQPWLPRTSIEEARRLAGRMLPHIPFAGRKVVYRLYILGETVQECSTALGLTCAKVQRIRKHTIVHLGKLVQQER
jgi:DNA-directed RNA polymerase specialized sigma24 family protein